MNPNRSLYVLNGPVCVTVLSMLFLLPLGVEQGFELSVYIRYVWYSHYFLIPMHDLQPIAFAFGSVVYHVFS